MSASGDKALLLWDVDHTLVNVAGISRVVYERAFQQVVGKPLGAVAVMTGRTERAIILETLSLNGIAEPDAALADFFAALGDAVQELTDEMREVGMALPGAAAAVEALGRTAVQSVVTGNIRSIAIAKLGAFNLGDGLDFEVGGYGDDGSDRADLVLLARKRAALKYETSFAGKRTYVIGDTPHDIRGAHDAGAYAVGVATGESSAAELEDAGADLVLADLTSLDALRSTLARLR